MSARVLRDQQGPQKSLQVWIVTDDEHVFAIVRRMEQLQEVGELGLWCQGRGFQHLGLVASFGRNQLRRLHRSLERTGVDRVKTDFHRVQHMGETEALLLAFLIEWAF